MGFALFILLTAFVAAPLLAAGFLTSHALRLAAACRRDEEYRFTTSVVASYLLSAIGLSFLVGLAFLTAVMLMTWVDGPRIELLQDIWPNAAQDTVEMTARLYKVTFLASGVLLVFSCIGAHRLVPVCFLMLVANLLAPLAWMGLAMQFISC